MSKTPFTVAQLPWLMGINYIDVRCKDEAVRHHVLNMMSRTSQMFKWTGLPDTIPAYILEQMLQGNGHCIIAQAEDNKLYTFTGGYGGEPDMYYRGTVYTVANTAVKTPNEYKIGVDCVLCRNDHLIRGLMPLNNRYASMLTENEISMHVAMVNSRMQDLITADNDADALAANDYLRNLEQGRLGSVLTRSFLQGITVQPGALSGSKTLTELIEMEQYIKASWYNELGLDSNYNMKRESLTQTESQMNSDALLPLVDDMYECRKEICKEAEMFGLALNVEYNSSWLDNQQQMNADPEEKPEGGEADEQSN